MAKIRFAELLERLEDQIDIREARKALKEGGKLVAVVELKKRDGL